MGVRGLESFMEKRCRNSVYKVSIGRLIQEYRSTVRDCPVIVCDGLSTVNFIYSGLDYIHGGQLKEFGQAVADFVQKFEEYGARLVFFFDGTLMPVKNATWIKRRSNELYDAIDLLDQLESGNLKASSLGPNRMICLPIGIREVFFYVLRYVCKCEFRIAVKDCDEEIARYAKNMNCFAILSQDTDFVIYDSARYYLSIKHLNTSNMTTCVYDRYALARHLDIDVSQLPLLASLMGNDIIHFEDLNDFHLRLLDTRPGYRPNFYYLPEKIASFIRRSNVKNLQAIAYRIFGNRAYTSLIRDSIYSYDLTIEDVDATSVDDKTGWSRILARAKELCISSNLSSSIYQILAFSIIYAGSNYEDYRKKDLPLTREVLSNLRRKIYGILLYEKPLTDGERCHYVEELVAGSPDSLCPGMKVEPLMPSEGEHPGLLELWDGVGKEAEDRRWNLIGEVLKLNKVQLETLRELEPRLIKVVITLIYVIDYTNNACLFGWEIDAIIAMALTLKNYNSQQLQSLPSDPVDVRAVKVYSLFGRSTNFIQILLDTCGINLNLHKDEDYYFMDGKLHRLKYWMAKKGSSLFDLCEKSDETLKLFTTVRNFIMNVAVPVKTTPGLINSQSN